MVYEIIIRFIENDKEAQDRVYPGASYSNDIALDECVRVYTRTKEELIKLVKGHQTLNLPEMSDLLQMVMLDHFICWSQVQMVAIAVKGQNYAFYRGDSDTVETDLRNFSSPISYTLELKEFNDPRSR